MESAQWFQHYSVNWLTRGLGRFTFTKKTAEILVGAKVEFPIRKKLFHLVVNPGTLWRPTMDLELVQTMRNV